jgi:anti-sigma regulatory factor (Ser/Thr protein kinase)
MKAYADLLGNVQVPVATVPDSRDVSLTIPAKPDYLVLARLALAAVCRLTPLSPEEVADLKLAVTEAAADFVDEQAADVDEARIDFSFRLEKERLVLVLEGGAGEAQPAEPSGDRDTEPSEQELGRAIIDATVDECDFAPGRTRLVKQLQSSG